MTVPDVHRRRFRAGVDRAIAAAEAAHRDRIPTIRALDAEHDRMVEQLNSNAIEIRRCRYDLQGKAALQRERADLVRQLADLDQRRAAAGYLLDWLLADIDTLRRCRQYTSYATPEELDWLSTQLCDIQSRIADLPDRAVSAAR